MLACIPSLRYAISTHSRAISSVSAIGGPARGWGSVIMYSVYVLTSTRNGKRYVGYTGKDPVVRLKEHNGGSNRYTNHNGPFVLSCIETFLDKTESIKRERFLKTGQGREFLDMVLRRGA